jgi:hypothetical protein
MWCGIVNDGQGKTLLFFINTSRCWSPDATCGAECLFSVKGPAPLCLYVLCEGAGPTVFVCPLWRGRPHCVCMSSVEGPATLCLYVLCEWAGPTVFVCPLWRGRPHCLYVVCEGAGPTVFVCPLWRGWPHCVCMSSVKGLAPLCLYVLSEGAGPTVFAREF